MSSLPSNTQYPAAAEDDRPRQSPEAQMTNEDITELDRFLQSPSTTPASQVPGARELLKAGQRRLRRLAQLQWKPTDPKIKAEEASRHLLVLQQEGFLDLPTPAAKKCLDSTMSGSKSVSNFSFRFSSQRDVEKIGQPWLENPLEVSDTQYIRGPEPSPSDLGNLTSMVEAAVSFPLQLDDAHPPPYQPTANTTSNRQIEGQDPNHLGGAACQLKPKEWPMGGQGGTSPANIEQVPTNDKGHTPSALIPGNGGACDDSKNGKSQAIDSPENQNNSAQLPNAKAVPRDPPNPAPQSLKLFPDTMPPRVSSKGAWRIPNSRIPGKDAPVPANISGRQQIRAPASLKRKTDNRSSDGQGESSSSYHLAKSSTTRPAKPCSEPAMSPIHPEFPQLNNTRRPASLPTGTIDSFPLPAPKRPLPSLPERPAALNTTRHRSTLVSEGATRINRNHSNAFPTTTSRNPVNAEDGSSNTQSALPRLRLAGKDTSAGEQGNSAEETPPYQPDSFARIEQNRAGRARAPELRDMMASDVDLKGSETSRSARKDDEINSPASPKSSGPGHELRTRDENRPRENATIRKEATSSAPVSPPHSPLPPPPPAQSAGELPFSRRYGGSPRDIMRASTESREPSLPSSNRSSTLHRSNSMRSVGVLHELASEQNISNRPGSPLPSSDDECMDRGTFKHELRQGSSRCRRTKVASRRSSDLCLNRHRAPNKSHIPDHVGPLTPQRQRSRILEEEASPPSLDSSRPYHSPGPRDKHDKAAHALNSLEGRIEQLERQNRILQAALFAALDVGVKPHREALLGGSTTSLSVSANSSRAERSSRCSTDRSSTLRGRAVVNGRKSGMKKSLCRPESWIDSPGSSLRSDYQTDDSDSVRGLEDMIEDFEVTWLSDKPGFSRFPKGRI